MTHNPAGLSLLKGTKLALSGSFAWRNLTYTRDPAAIDDILTDPDVGAGTPEGDGVLANSGESTLSNFVATPFFALGSDFGIQGFGAAIGLYVPIGGGDLDPDPGTAREGFPDSGDVLVRWWTVRAPPGRFSLRDGRGRLSHRAAAPVDRPRAQRRAHRD